MGSFETEAARIFRAKGIRVTEVTPWAEEVDGSIVLQHGYEVQIGLEYIILLHTGEDEDGMYSEDIGEYPTFEKAADAYLAVLLEKGLMVS